MLLKPWKLLFGSGKKKKKEFLYNKDACNNINKIVRKVGKLCHIVESKFLAKQLPLSWEEATCPSPVGSSFPIINWFAPMHQTNVATSFSFSPQLRAQGITTTKTQQQKQ